MLKSILGKREGIYLVDLETINLKRSLKEGNEDTTYFVNFDLFYSQFVAIRLNITL